MLSQQDGQENSGWVVTILEKRNVELGQPGWTIQASSASAAKTGAKVHVGLNYGHSCGISPSFPNPHPPTPPTTFGR